MGFYVTPGTCGARYLIGPQIYTEATKGRSFKAITQLPNYLSQRKKGATGAWPDFWESGKGKSFKEPVMHVFTHTYACILCVCMRMCIETKGQCWAFFIGCWSSCYLRHSLLLAWGLSKSSRAGGEQAYFSALYITRIINVRHQV